MLSVIVSILGILITLLLVIGIHELGHFLVAKASGISVLKFSIGFGKAMKTWRDKSGTEYVLGMIPLGGYVKMLDETEGDVPASVAHLSYNRQPYYRKFAVVAAGPLSNLLFALLLYWLLFMFGFVTVAPVIGEVKPHSIAFDAGIKSQEQITQMNGLPTSNWTAVVIQLITLSGDAKNLTLETKDIENHEIKSYQLNLSHWHLDEYKPDPLDSLGILPYEPIIPAVIGTIEEDSPASKSKLLIGDKIIAINQNKINDWKSLSKALSEHPNETLNFTLVRQNKTLTLPVSIGSKHPWFFKSEAFLGVSPAFEWPSKLLIKNHYGPVRAFVHALNDVEIFTKLNFVILGKMLSGKMSLKSLGGPITIFQSAGYALNQGIVAFMSFLAFLSISIGIMNVLPIPGLDGGHLMFQTIEAIIRKPISPKIIDFCYRVGITFILCIMLQAIYNDVARIIWT